MPPTDQARWFSAHVQPYEPALRAYLQKRFPALPDHDDLVQETYIRALPERGRQVMMLRHLDGLACKEIAERRARSRHRRVRRQPQAARRSGRIRFQFPT